MPPKSAIGSTRASCDRTMSMPRAHTASSRLRGGKELFNVNQTESRRATTAVGNSRSFKDSINRFEQYASARKILTPKELKTRSRMGPGTYDVAQSSSPKSKGGGAGGRSSSPTPSLCSIGMQATNVPAQFTIFPVPQAPPVGTYNIPQIMNAKTHGEMGIQVRSPFKSSGRSKALMLDGSHYSTLREDVRMSNVGPGTYDAVDSFMGKATVSPMSNDRTFRAHQAHAKEEQQFRSTLQQLRRNAREASSAFAIPSMYPGAGSNSSTAGMGPGGDGGSRPSTPSITNTKNLGSNNGGSASGGRKRSSPPGSGGKSGDGGSVLLLSPTCIYQREILEVQQLPAYK